MGKRSKRQPSAVLSVRSWRLNAGLTVDELAILAGVAPNTVRRLEHGYRSTVLKHVAEARVADSLGVPVEAVAFGAEDDEPTLDLATERETRRLTLGEVAEATGVPLRSLRRAEAGSAVQPRYAKRIADFYGCRVSDFYPLERRPAAAA